MSGATTGVRGRGTAIAAIKLVHSMVFLVNRPSVLHVFRAGLLGRTSRWTRFALAAALAESAVFVANRGRCPLTRLVEDLGAESGRASDIFLPRWCADRVPLIFGPPLAVGVLALAGRSMGRLLQPCRATGQSAGRRPAGSAWCAGRQRCSGAGARCGTPCRARRCRSRGGVP